MGFVDSQNFAAVPGLAPGPSWDSRPGKERGRHSPRNPRGFPTALSRRSRVLLQQECQCSDWPGALPCLMVYLRSGVCLEGRPRVYVRVCKNAQSSTNSQRSLLGKVIGLCFKIELQMPSQLRRGRASGWPPCVGLHGEQYAR